jgi:hypothetical protein
MVAKFPLFAWLERPAYERPRRAGAFSYPTLARLDALRASDMFRRIGQERHMPRAFERNTQAALVLRARTCLATWLNLAAIRNVAAQARRVFVVNLTHPIHAKCADLSP